jgi:hypothetical protein
VAANKKRLQIILKFYAQVDAHLLRVSKCPTDSGEKLMLKRLIVVTVLSLFVACGGNAPRQKPKPIDPYIILGSTAEPATKTYRLMIRVDPPITEENIKKTVEMAIEKYKPGFDVVIVNSYTTSNTNTTPYAVSRYDSNGVTHQFNSQMAPQQIPTH